MKNKTFNQSNYIYDIADNVKNAKLYLDGDIIVNDFVEEDFFRRKNLISFEFVKNLDESIVKNVKDAKILKEGSFKFSSPSKILVNFAGYTFDSKNLNLLMNELYYYQIYAFVDIPYISSSLSEEKRKEYIYKESEVFNMYVVISSSPLKAIFNSSFNPKMRIFDNFGTHGFILVDIEKVNTFFKKHERKISNDLFEEFTTTELANELFDAGLMCLSWGMTPWHYYICTEENDKITMPKGKLTEYVGVYKFDESIKNISVIPGNYINDWEKCINTKWQELKLIEKGNGITLSLYANYELSTLDRIQTGIQSPIGTFCVKRITLKADEKTKPLLESYLVD